MKNMVKLCGIIALVAVIGFTLAGCGNDPDNDGTPYYTPPVVEERDVTTSGRLTITGLSECQGGLIMGVAYPDGGYLYAWDRGYHFYIDGVLENSGGDYAVITGDSVTLKVFFRSTEGNYENYTGNDDNLGIMISIYFDEDGDGTNEDSVHGNIYSVNFANGIASGAFVPNPDP